MCFLRSSSIPCSSVCRSPAPPPYSDDELSRVLCDAYLASLAGQANSSAQPADPCDMRVAFISWIWFGTMMRPHDRARLTHFFSDQIDGSAAMPRTEYQTPVSWNERITTATKTCPSAVSCTSLHPSASPTEAACTYTCTLFHHLSSMGRCNLTWHLSPSTCSADHSDGPNMATLVMKRPESRTQAQTELHTLADCAKHIHNNLIALDTTDRRLADTALVSDPFARPEDYISSGDSFSLVSSACVDSSGPSNYVLESPMFVQVNASFERLFGYSQCEMVANFERDMDKAYYKLLQPNCWPTIMELDFASRWQRRYEYRQYVVCRTRWSAEVPCLLCCTNKFDRSRQLSEQHMSFIPLPAG